jgi:hypothetical protein
MPDKSVFRRLAAGFLIAGLAGCSASLEQIYTESVKTSAVVSTATIHPLMAIPAGRTSVDVVTWTTQPTAQKYYPFGKTRVGIDVWVTLSPQVKQLCTAYRKDPKALRLRLQQLLGLPPDAAGTPATPREFVVINVSTADIFRPCPDPDPTKPQCGLTFPKSLPNGEANKAWFAEQVNSRYQDPNGYPWTRLGYTFDWNPETQRYGASEYVIRKGSAVTVKTRTSTAEYCR